MSFPYHTPLTPDQQAHFGIETPAALAMADQVRFSELDALNHVNNAVYMTWFERLRVRYVQEWGLSPQGQHLQGPRIVIRSGEIHYRQEMVMDENYMVTCQCNGFRNTSFSLAQQIWAGGCCRATFDCVVVLLNQDGSGRYPIPDKVRQRFVQVDGAIAN